jgi:hypothetical protein
MKALAESGEGAARASPICICLNASKQTCSIRGCDMCTCLSLLAGNETWVICQQAQPPDSSNLKTGPKTKFSFGFHMAFLIIEINFEPSEKLALCIGLEIPNYSNCKVHHYAPQHKRCK